MSAEKSRDLGALDAVLTVEQVATVLQLGKNKVYDLVRTGEIQAVKVGSVYRVPRRSLQQFLGVDEADLLSQQAARREEVEALLTAYRAAQDQVSRVSARLLELGVAVPAPEVRGA